MNIKTTSFFFKRLCSVLSLFMLMFLFQNCGTSEDSLSDALATEQERRANALPFAFDFTVDLMGYMSCESTSLAVSPSHFNFKIGAYGDGEGLKFREKFNSSIGALRDNRETLLNYLRTSVQNVNAGVVMSIREFPELRGPVIFENGTSAVEYVAPILYDPTSRVLSDPEISGIMYDNPGGVNYLKGYPGLLNKTFDGQLSIGRIGKGLHEALVRPSLENGTGYLALTFPVDDVNNGGALARSPQDPAGIGNAARNSVFGKGYKMTFTRYDNSGQRPNSPRNVMESVTGFNMEQEGATLGEDWICPVSERYIIMRDLGDARRRFDDAPATKVSNGSVNNPTDLDYEDGGPGRGGYYMDYLSKDEPGSVGVDALVTHKVLCPTIPDEMVVSQSEHTDLAWIRIRNLLSVEDWYVYRGGRYNCIAPKRGANACYGKVATAGDGSAPILQYFASEDFVGDRVKDINDGGTGTIIVESNCEGNTQTSGNRFCPEILSVCYKRVF